MTAKIKAKEIFDKYKFVYIQNYTSDFEVKQCALILVDEIIEELSSIEFNYDLDFSSDLLIYWNNVRTEIECIK